MYTLSGLERFLIPTWKYIIILNYFNNDERSLCVRKVAKTTYEKQNNIRNRILQIIFSI